MVSLIVSLVLLFAVHDKEPFENTEKDDNAVNVGIYGFIAAFLTFFIPGLSAVVVISQIALIAYFKGWFDNIGIIFKRIISNIKLPKIKFPIFKSGDTYNNCNFNYYNGEEK